MNFSRINFETIPSLFSSPFKSNNAEPNALKNVISVGMGLSHVIVLTKNNRVYTFGLNNNYVLGSSSTSSKDGSKGNFKIDFLMVDAFLLRVEFEFEIEIPELIGEDGKIDSFIKFISFKFEDK